MSIGLFRSSQESYEQWIYNNSMEKIGKRRGYYMVQKLGRTKNMIKVGKISEKYDISTVEEKIISLIGNKMRRILEMTP